MSVGGIATFVLNLSQILCQAGHAVTVIAQQPGAWWACLAESGVQGYCPPCRRWDSVQQTARRFTAYLAAQQIDLLLVNIGIDNRLPLLALHLLPEWIAVALVLHNDRPEVYAQAAGHAAAWNCAVAVSPKVQQMAQVRFPQKPIHWILHGLVLPTREQLCERVGWRIPLRLLFVGRLDDAQKGIFRLPMILQRCQEQGQPVHLTVIGDGPDRVALANLCQRAGVADLVDLLGFQASEIVVAQMRTHHILLLPSNFEGLGMVIQEAQANGCVPNPLLNADLRTLVANSQLLFPDNPQACNLGVVRDLRPYFKRDAMMHLNLAEQTYRAATDMRSVAACAHEQLDRMAVVGLTDHFAASTVLLCDLLGVPSPKVLPQKNVGAHRASLAQRYRDQLPPDLLAKIAAKTQYDQALYLHAGERFAEQQARYRARPRRTYSIVPRLRTVPQAFTTVSRSALERLAKTTIGQHLRTWRRGNRIALGRK